LIFAILKKQNKDDFRIKKFLKYHQESRILLSTVCSLKSWNSGSVGWLLRRFWIFWYLKRSTEH